jgi:hypothetical protein
MSGSLGTCGEPVACCVLRAGGVGGASLTAPTSCGLQDVVQARGNAPNATRTHARLAMPCICFALRRHPVWTGACSAPASVRQYSTVPLPQPPRTKCMAVDDRLVCGLYCRRYLEIQALCNRWQRLVHRARPLTFTPSSQWDMLHVRGQHPRRQTATEHPHRSDPRGFIFLVHEQFSKCRYRKNPPLKMLPQAQQPALRTQL